MSRRRQSGAVRGPASALTSFLAGLGVEPSTRLTTWGNSSAIPNGQEETLAHDGPVITADDQLDPAGAVTARTVEAGPSNVGEGSPEEEEPVASGSNKPRQSRDQDVDSDDLDASPVSKKPRTKRDASVDSEDLDTQTPVNTASGRATPARESKVKPGPLKAVGNFMTCGECETKFTVTAYTKEHPRAPSTYLCVPCCYSLGINPFEKVKKAIKKAPGKDDRAKIIHYEERKGVVGLSDLCIQLIGNYIEDVDRLGDIGAINMDKVCRIISKSRKLTPETASLLYSADRTELALYDCTRLVHDSYVTLANLCPNIEKLHLHLCGQLMANTLKHWAQALPRLQRLELYAPFLVRKDGWISLIESAGARLKGFLVTQSPRIDVDIVNALVDSCPDLTELRLSEIGLLDGDCLAAIAGLPHLTLLDLSAPANSLNDADVATLLAAVGSRLAKLDLSDNPDLTDATLSAIADHCPNLGELCLRNLVELTDQGVADFFSNLSAKGHRGFRLIDLEKGHDLQDAALDALLTHSGSTVERLSVLGWRDVSSNSIESVGRCPLLRDLNLGWCRKLTDFALKEILDACPSIETIRVWGCNQLSDRVPRKKGVKVIGIESHSI